MNPQETLELAAFIHELRDKYELTIFLIEHHMDLVMRISDYIYVIDFGKQDRAGHPPGDPEQSARDRRLSGGCGRW